MALYVSAAPLAVACADADQVTVVSASNSLSPASEGSPEEPPATETNFFSIGCREDADCDGGKICRLPAGAEAADAALPPGLCVAPPRE